MKEIVQYVSEYDQQPLYGSLFYDEHAIKGIVQILHGMAEHRHRYDWFAQQLLQAGYVVLTCDLRGHGDSAETLGYFAKENGWLINVEDMYGFTKMIKARFDLPVILFGHSMGTLVARSYLKRHEAIVDKVVLSGSPANNKAIGSAITLAKLIEKFKGDKYRSPLLNKLSFGSFNKGIADPRTDFDWLSVNPDNVDAYIKDELCGYPFTVSGYLDLFSGIKDVYEGEDWHISDPLLPIKFFSGEYDPCMNTIKGLKEAVDCLRLAGYQYVEYEIISGLRHEILNEKERAAVCGMILDFIEEA